jgi:hypothetical protein
MSHPYRLGAVAAAALLLGLTKFVVPDLSVRAFAQAQQPVDNRNVPLIAFESVPDFLKYPPTMNLGEVLGVAVNSKGRIVVLNHPGSATSGPLYGNATTQLLEFDSNGKFVREIGQGVYGLGYAHSVRFDKYDNLWVVDKGTHSVMKFNPAGYVTMNLGRRPEGVEEHQFINFQRGDQPPVHRDGYFNQPTDVTWDQDDNIFISDGYLNSRVAKIDKNGNWVKSWGSRGSGGEHANENASQFNTPHNIGADRQGNIYVADRGNRRIQVFDRDGGFQRFMFLNVPYDKKRQLVLGSMPASRPDETQPWAICITNTTPQYLFAVDSEPGRLYKMTLDGKMLGMLGESGRQLGQFNWPHALACPSENEVLVADLNNWRVQKLVLRSGKPATGSSR